MPTGRTINMTRRARTWGHNVAFIKEDDAKTAEYWIWVTPKPKVGDWMTYEVSSGLVTVQLDEVEWTRNVDDMYRIKVSLVSWDDNVQ